MKTFIKEWGPMILIIAFFGLARLFVFTPVTVKGHSMDPTLADGQRLISLKVASIDRMDIVTTKEPGEEDKMVVKRVIGIPGDHVQMKDDVLTINGEVVEEPYLDAFKEKFKEDQLQEEYSYDEGFQMRAQSIDTFTDDFDYTVPKGQYFVLGDNRPISKDSRIFGFVDANYIQGEVVLRYWPLNKISLT